MKWSMATVGVIILGIIGISIMLLFQQLNTSSEKDYYLLKEIMEASMTDAIDISYYRQTGEVKIVREKFVETFIKRYTESTLFIGTKYIISFYDIMEYPPKATVIIDTGIESYRVYKDISDYNVKNNLTGILEYTNANTKKSSSSWTWSKLAKSDKEITKTYYSSPAVNEGNISVTEPLNLPKELEGKNIELENIEITYDGLVTDEEELLQAKLKRDIDWTKPSTNRKEYGTEYTSNDSYDIANYYTDSKKFTFAPTNINGTNYNIVYYDCQKRINNSNTAQTNFGVDCNTYNTIWINYTGTIDNWNTNDKYITIKLKITFTYSEYEY